MTGWHSTKSPRPPPYGNERTLVGLPFPLYFLFIRRLSRVPTIRSVTPEEPKAHLRNDAALGTPRRGTASWIETLFLLRVLLVGIDDARDQGVAHHVLGAELRKGDAAHALEDAARLDQAALAAAREVGLRHVAVHHRFRPEADAGEEHLHLLRRGVLRLVEDDEGV